MSRSRWLKLRVTDQEHQSWQNWAEAQQLTISGLLRSLVEQQSSLFHPEVIQRCTRELTQCLAVLRSQPTSSRETPEVFSKAFDLLRQIEQEVRR